MIALKKSDKLIIIIAVIVIIVAAIGILLYTVPEETVSEPEEEKLIFDVYSSEKSGTAYPDNTDYTVRDKIIGNMPYTGTVKLSYDNLKSVEFTITYSDTKTGLFGFGIIGRRLGLGMDTLAVTITDPDGNIIEEQIKGSGNITVTYPNINSMILTSQIEAETEDDAEIELENLYKNRWKDKAFDIEISLDVKERLLRKLLFERGDSFDLDIKYSYYEYSLEKVKTEETSTDYDFGGLGEEGYTPQYMSMLLNTAQGRYI